MLISKHLFNIKNFIFRDSNDLDITVKVYDNYGEDMENHMKDILKNI